MTCPEYPSPRPWSYVETIICIPRGYHLVALCKSFGACTITGSVFLLHIKMRDAHHFPVQFYSSSCGINYAKQECIPVGCVLTACYRAGGLHDKDPPDRDPRGQRPPPILDRDLPPPGQRPPCGQTNTCENIIFANFVCER